MSVEAASGFRRHFGYDPTGVWAAPGRVNLIGEHTDYNEGVVLPFAIAERTEAAIASRQDGHIRMCSLQHPGEIVEVKVGSLSPGLPRGWAAYAVGVAWAMECEEGFDLAIDGSVPLGSGLSSSAALTCSVGLGLNELFGFGMTRRQVARAAQAAENDYVGAPTGGMDQIASLLCRSGHALLYDVRADTTDQVPFAPEAAGLSVLVVDSMVRHGHAGGEYQSRREDCEESARRLSVRSLRGVTVADLPIALEQLGDERLVRRTRHVVTENQRVFDVAAALARDDWERVGRLLTAAHESYRDDFAASCPEVDVAVAVLLESGALGARLTGGGFGGAAIALIRTDDIDDAGSAVATAYDERGYQPASMFTVMPSAGAQRIA